MWHADIGRKRKIFKQLLPGAVALKFTVHGVQSFIKGHRKSGVISIKHSRDITNRISPLRVESYLFSTTLYTPPLMILDPQHLMWCKSGQWNHQHDTQSVKNITLPIIP